jgi:3-deoxy-D-manno-octulosonic-acid transferase
MQTQEDKNKLLALGVASEKILVTGNTKFDGWDEGLTGKEPLKNWDIEEFFPVIVAGSTHPGEEEILLNVFNKIIPKYPDAN